MNERGRYAITLSGEKLEVYCALQSGAVLVRYLNGKRSLWKISIDGTERTLTAPFAYWLIKRGFVEVGSLRDESITYVFRAV